MLVLSNGYTEEFFSCHLELIDFLGQETFVAVMEGIHSQYNITYFNIT
jgi:hypothetical protein